MKPPIRLPLGIYSTTMELKATYDMEHMALTPGIQHELWPLDEIDPAKDKFPCCLVWTPLPVVSWLAPFIGHVGICQEDGVILDFSGSNFVNVDSFAFGAVARYLQLDRKQVDFHSVLQQNYNWPYYVSIKSKLAPFSKCCLAKKFSLFHNEH